MTAIVQIYPYSLDRERNAQMTLYCEDQQIRFSPV